MASFIFSLSAGPSVTLVYKKDRKHMTPYTIIAQDSQNKPSINKLIAHWPYAPVFNL